MIRARQLCSMLVGQFLHLHFYIRLRLSAIFAVLDLYTAELGQPAKIPEITPLLCYDGVEPSWYPWDSTMELFTSTPVCVWSSHEQDRDYAKCLTGPSRGADNAQTRV